MNAHIRQIEIGVFLTKYHQLQPILFFSNPNEIWDSLL